MIKTGGGEITRLKEIPVPQSVASKALTGTTTFERPPAYIRNSIPTGIGAGTSYNAIPYSYCALARSRRAQPPRRRGPTLSQTQTRTRAAPRACAALCTG